MRTNERREGEKRKKDKVSDVQVATYASKLKKEPILYEDFKEKYKQKEK